ncbi:hypothetical protein K7B10_37830 [Streptomyces flavotricini]|uniref:Uncharacterized protein n=1 Tax=Streptomyces flavotricini TaxID=66888 RepID=A0ABS8EH03_9ACTN|nr:hypothetical protein [Streptomyces flavotricini]MCC0100436.1 hypothetical protein [Streptomyces flavotricini]
MDTARDNAADLRRLAGQITALTSLPADSETTIGDLNRPSPTTTPPGSCAPLADTRTHLRPEDAELADRIDALTRHTDQLRQDTHDQRST